MDGIICIDKPQDMTSFSCCAVMRRLLGEKKVGHAGTLDPMATGVLPLLTGKATRALELLPCHDKRYQATMRFGYVSDTQDVWGRVEPTGAFLPAQEAVEEALSHFRGEIAQTPPMMSALKRDGVRLYELARQGVEVEREARAVTIYSLRLLAYDPQKGELSLDCACSKGTYIRTLCADLGERLGCGGVMTALRRTEAAGYPLERCITLDEARRLAEAGSLFDRVMPVESAFSNYPEIRVSPAQAVRFGNGGGLALERLNSRLSVWPDGRAEGTVRVKAPDGRFLGLGRPEGGELKILRLF